MDRRNPHNSYYYKPMDQAAPIYVPPSKSTQRILPVPQEAGQGDYHYGRPGEARPIYIPPSHSSGKHISMDPSNPYASILQQQMGPQGMGGGIAPVQSQPMQVPPMQMPQQPPQQQQQGGGGAMAGMMGGMMKSDERSKKEIERLSAQNDALTKALGGSHAQYPDTSAPSSGLQALGQQDAPSPRRTSVDGTMLRSLTGATTGPDGLTDERRDYYAQKEREARGTSAPPMSTDLARWAQGGFGPADKVAAQNAALGQLPPQQQAQAPSGGFQVNRGMPDLSALDEAYRRIGAEQGG